MAQLKPSSSGSGIGLALEAKRAFRAMNTDIELTASDWAHAARLPRIEAMFHDFEARFSRFRPDSELSTFNDSEADTVAISPAMADLLEECLRMYDVTGGLFNPLTLAALEMAGYDRSFEQIGPGPESATACEVPSFDALGLDASALTASLPKHLRLDFGGIGKGYCVDLAADALADAHDFLINAGGDIYAAGRGPDGGRWRIDVADPLAPDRVLSTVAVSDEAIATSWTTKRRWRTAAGWTHHLIDPRTGLAAASGAISATVIAPSATEADVFAKAALILGPVEGIAFLEDLAVDGLLVRDDGSTISTAGWWKHLTAT
jgi:thiamine biosynthesis lipoprotein